MSRSGKNWAIHLSLTLPLSVCACVCVRVSMLRDVLLFRFFIRMHSKLSAKSCAVFSFWERVFFLVRLTALWPPNPSQPFQCACIYLADDPTSVKQRGERDCETEGEKGREGEEEKQHHHDEHLKASLLRACRETLLKVPFSHTCSRPHAALPLFSLSLSRSLRCTVHLHLSLFSPLHSVSLSLLPSASVLGPSLSLAPLPVSLSLSPSRCSLS